MARKEASNSHNIVCQLAQLTCRSLPIRAISKDYRYQGRKPVVPLVLSTDFFAPMHAYIGNNIQYIECIEDTTNLWRANHDAMMEEFDRLKA